MKPKRGRGTGVGGEHRLEMFHGLQERIGLTAGWWGLDAAERGSQLIQPVPQATAQPIEGFHGKRQPQFLDRRLERKPGQEFEQPAPHPRRRQGVTGQHLSPEHGKGASAPAAAAAIGTKDPLPTRRAGIRAGRIIAVELAVAV